VPYTGEMSFVLTVDAMKTLFHSRLTDMAYPSGLSAFKKLYNWEGSSDEALIEELPHIQTPSVVTWYRGSDWGDFPRRKQHWRFYVVVSAVAKPKASWEAASNEAAKYVEDIVDAFTRTILDDDARCDIKKDMAIVVDPAIAAYQIDVDVFDA
jgi:hypothetical protein